MHGEMVNRGEGCAYARPEQASDLKTIWLRSFPGDTGEDVDAFFSALFRPEECLVYLAEGRPVSMTFALPAVFRAQGESVPVQYIYAASTLPEWRGRGIFGRLLEFACGQGARQGMAASFLRPGEKSLFDYYRRFDYRPFFTGSVVRLPPRPGKDGPVRPLPAEGYAAARSRALADFPFWLEWSGVQAFYAVRNAEAAGGCALESPGGCALCHPDGDTLRVEELLCPPEEEELFYRAFSAFGCSSWEIRRPGGGESFGMWRPLSPVGERLFADAADPYMGLSLE